MRSCGAEVAGSTASGGGIGPPGVPGVQVPVAPAAGSVCGVAAINGTKIR